MEAEDKKWLAELDALIHKAMKDNQLSVDLLAREMNISSSQLYRKLQLLRGVSVQVYIQEMRLDYAFQLLKRREVDSVKAAAYTVGFMKVRYFSEVFKERFGVLPSSLLE
jgi:AraC-like DNA-binding protein